MTLIPTPAFLLKIATVIESAAQALDGVMIGLWLSKDDRVVSADQHKELVAGFQAQGFASLARNHDLVLR
jgi:hypothetical protein